MKAGWKDETLGGIFEIGSSKRVLQKQWQREGVPFYRARQIVKLAKEGSVENDLFISEDHFAELKDKHGVPSSGDLMVSAVGTLGACYVVQPDDRFYFKDASVLRFHPKVDIESRFYQYAFQWNGLLDTVKKSDGATVGTLTISRAKDIPVPLPPLEEQERIVAVLDEAFEGLARARAHAEANLQNARELFDRAVFELFEDLRIEHPTLELSEMAEKITKGSSPKWQGISYVDEPGVLFVTSENVGKNEIDLTKTKYVEEAFNEKDRKSILAKGDVLTNIVGASIGRTAVFELDDVANINQAVCLIRCDSKRLNNYFLSYLLNSPYFKTELHAGEVNMARANLSLTFFRELKVPVPPVDIQEGVVQKVDALRLKTETLEKDYQSKLQDLDDLRQSILQKAFAGELT